MAAVTFLLRQEAERSRSEVACCTLAGNNSLSKLFVELLRNLTHRRMPGMNWE